MRNQAHRRYHAKGPVPNIVQVTTNQRQARHHLLRRRLQDPLQHKRSQDRLSNCKSRPDYRITKANRSSAAHRDRHNVRRQLLPQVPKKSHPRVHGPPAKSKVKQHQRKARRHPQRPNQPVNQGAHRLRQRATRALRTRKVRPIHLPTQAAKQNAPNRQARKSQRNHQLNSKGMKERLRGVARI